MTRLRSQRGLAAALFILIVILGAVALILGRGAFQADADLDRREVTAERMTRISKALVDFAIANQRLPCPARGDEDSGLAAPEAASSSCTAEAGVVPWRTLVLRREDSVDGWGRKISYRAYVGTGNKSLTQGKGLDLTNCNSDLTQGYVNLDSSNLCQPATANPYQPQVPPNSKSQFVSARGGMLTVDDLGTSRTPVAFVLISHGATGLGAYLAEGGTRMSLPNAAGNEYRNSQANGTYYVRSQSAQSIASSDPNHFDDLVTYKLFDDLVAEARLPARSWGKSNVETSLFTASTLDAAIDAAGGSTSGFNTGLQSIDFGAFTVSAYGDSARNVGFDRTTGTGIGSIGTGTDSQSASTINEATNEELLFIFDTPARYLGITLSSFGGSSFDRERVRFRFVVGGSSVAISKTSCKNEGVVNFVLNPGGDFTEVQVEARTTATFGLSSSFRVDAIAACDSSNPSCPAPFSNSANNCP